MNSNLSLFLPPKCHNQHRISPTLEPRSSLRSCGCVCAVVSRLVWMRIWVRMVCRSVGCRMVPLLYCAWPQLAVVCQAKNQFGKHLADLILLIFTTIQIDHLGLLTTNSPPFFCMICLFQVLLLPGFLSSSIFPLIFLCLCRVPFWMICLFVTQFTRQKTQKVIGFFLNSWNWKLHKLWFCT